MHEIHVECTVKTYKEDQSFGKTINLGHPIRITTSTQGTIDIWQGDDFLFCVDGDDMIKAIECCQKGQS